MFKNTANQQWVVFAFQDEGGANPGEPVTADQANITANVRIDAGAANAVDDTNPTVLEDGYYSFGITAAESNGDSIVITPVSATANVNVIGVPGAVYTRAAFGPTVAEFDARTLVSASYFDPAADAVANVTLVATTTVSTDAEADIAALNNAPAVTAAAIVNEWETQSQADPTGFHVNVQEWVGNAVTQGTGGPDVNINAISDDTTAPANLELMYNLTGYTDTTAPASRSQVDGLTASSGGSVNVAASEDNTSGAIDPGSTTKVWATVAGTFANTEADNGLSHDFTDTGDVISHVYGFSVGGGRTATAVDFLGNVDGNTDEMQIEVWDHVGADWEVIGTIGGSGATTNVALDLPLLSKHTGTSAAEIGKVYIQMDTNSTTPSDLNVELLLIQAVNIGQTVGYEGGRIWINTGGTANTNTESFVDGVADNTVSIIAAAKTISTNTGLSDFQIINGSTITLGESTDNESYFGDEWTLVLNGQSCASAHFEGASVSGVQTGTAASFHLGEVGAVTVADEAHFNSMGLGGVITLPVGSAEFTNCHHDGDSTPVLDFGAVGSTTVHCHNYHGAIEVQNMGDSGTDILHLDGDGTLTVNANGSGGTIHLRGMWKIIDVAKLATINKEDISGGIIYGIADAGTLSTTVMTSDLTGFADDELIGRAIIWTSGDADGQASDITDYASSAGTVTYTAITTLPAAGDSFKIV